MSSRRAASIGSVSVPSSPEPADPGQGPSAAPAGAPEDPGPLESPASAAADLPAAGAPDAFDRLWTPHRLAYIKGAGKPTGPGAHEGCPFCTAPTLSDEDVAANAVSFRYRSGEQKNTVPIAEAIEEIVAAVNNRIQV